MRRQRLCTTEDFDAFYMRIVGRLALSAISRDCPAEVVRELIQDVMLRMYSRWGSIRPATRDNYAYVATRHAVLDWHKKHATRLEVLGLDDESADIRRRNGPLVSSVEAEVEGRDLEDRILIFITTRLAEREREVLLMYLAGREPSEIARALGRVSVRTSLQIARQKLKAFLRAEEGGPADARD